MVLADAYSRALDFKTAREHAATADELWIRYGTEEHDNVQAMRDLWEEIDRRDLLDLMGPKEKWHYEVDHEDHDEL